MGGKQIKVDSRDTVAVLALHALGLTAEQIQAYGELAGAEGFSLGQFAQRVLLGYVWGSAASRHQWWGGAGN